ncbi:hypothetical protein ABEB36_001940 [Hypothenemus hampei]|uniref:Mitochondrial carrier homolog 2 n=1 Tax=Hypothenemus hampei TaxID=57062 RepID=A0ABD1FJR5_HYPHA
METGEWNFLIPPSDMEWTGPDLEEMSNPQVMSKQKDNKWSNHTLKVFVNTASHPFDYAKVLIQLGYEPIAPRPATTFFGKPALKLPNIFEYVKHIKSVDGFTGLYRGLGPKICGNLLSAIVAQKCTDFLKADDENSEYDEEDSEEQRQQKWLFLMKCDMITHTAAIVVSHPFYVITIRTMGQFVGKETKYTGIFGSIKEIYHQNGMFGFFSGLIPRLLGDLCSLLLAGSLTYAFNRYLVEDKELKVYISATMNFISTAVMYPFQVVSTCMTVTNSGLAIGSPPHMPHYPSWVDCWIALNKTNQLKRGSSFLMRYYTGPHIRISGKLLPVNGDQTLYIAAEKS